MLLLPNFEGTSRRGGLGGDQGEWTLSFTLPDLHQLVPSKLGSTNVGTLCRAVTAITPGMR